jgi:hypothetical protein
MRKIKEGRPILGSWTNVYVLMVAVLVLLMLFFYCFTRHFA